MTNGSNHEKILYTVKEVSELIHTNQAYVYTLIRAGLLPALKLCSYKVRKEARFVFLEANEGKNLNDPHNIRNTYEPDYDDEVEPGGETGVEIGGCVPLVYHTEKICDGDMETRKTWNRRNWIRAAKYICLLHLPGTE